MVDLELILLWVLIHMLLANNRIKQNMDRGLKFPLEEMHVVWYHAARDDDTRAAH